MYNYVDKYAIGRLAKLQLEAEGRLAKLQLDAKGRGAKLQLEAKGRGAKLQLDAELLPWGWDGASGGNAAAMPPLYLWAQAPKAVCAQRGRAAAERER